MPRSELKKIDIESRVLKLKDELYSGTLFQNFTKKQKEAAHQVLNSVLDILQEYRY